MMQDQIPESLQSLKHEVHKRYKAELKGIFGSYTRDEAREDSAGHMEGVTVAILQKPPFVYLTISIPGTIPKDTPAELQFTVQSVNQDSSGTFKIKVTHNMQTKGLFCTPEEWEKTVEPSVSSCDDNDPDRDIDNSDSTFLQCPIGGDSPSTCETPYQFSPTSSPDVQDTLEIDYNVTHTSQVSILIYDYDGTLVRTLMNSEARNSGDVYDIWDGRDDSEELVPDGIYRFIISGVNIENTLDEWSIPGEGTHGHYFFHADDTMSLTYNDNIIQYVYIDPANPLQQILMQFYTDNGSSKHRVYWGNNSIPVGSGWGSSFLYQMGKHA